MNNIRVDIRLRPIRFGFLVRPDDKKKVLEIFRINTCLWGGMFNPIIPFFKRVPPWWERHGDPFETAKQIINGYLDFFEPDFLVEAETGLGNEFGYDSERVLQLTDILEESRQDGWNKVGLSVNDLYSYLHQVEYRFELRHQHNILHVKPKERAFDGFVAAYFGSFPTSEELRYFEQKYNEIFKPKPISLDAAGLAEFYQSKDYSAVHVTIDKLRIDYHDDLGGIRLFIMDAKKTRDLIDFWNLRATHSFVDPIPIQWIEELSDFCKKRILDTHRSQVDDQEIDRFRTTAMFSRSIPESNIEEIYKKYLHVDKTDATTRQMLYPPIWRKRPERTINPTRPTLEADRKSMDIQISGDETEIQINPIFPDFPSEFAKKYNVANIINIKDWTNSGQITTVFPCDYKKPTFPRLRLGRVPPLPTTEGLVFFPKFGIATEQWYFVDGTTAFSQWLNNEKVSATLSDAGSTTQQIIETLGGISGVRHLAHRKIIDLLDEISRRPITKTAHYNEFENKIGNAIGNNEGKKITFDSLVQRKVVELGLELKCSKCKKWSWYSITQLDYSLTCTFCIKQFDFPITKPIGKKHSRWAYHLIGPFALTKYADGGYAAALGIHFFACIFNSWFRSAVTWSTGLELTLPIGKKVEVDFMFWYQQAENANMNYPTETVFGEAKSFGEDAITQDDVNKMKLLAEAFPGSILVFATMKECLAQKEIIRIRKLALWGRKYDKDRKQTRAPVIVLTGRDLFRDRALIIDSRYTRTENLRVLADLTQQLYLKMPSD